MDANSIHMQKLYTYTAKGLLISFERELLVAPDVILSLNLQSTSPNHINLGSDRKISNAVKHRIHSLLTECVELGALYLIYELVLEALAMSLEVLEFLSRSIFYLKQKVHHNLRYEDKLTTLRIMHVIQSGIIMFDKHILESVSTFRKLCDVFGVVRASVTDKLLLDAHMPFVIDMTDSYEFTRQCLQRELNEINALSQVMETVTQVRANQTQMNLSLIATVFLPMTFLAGVFGMNFTVDGGTIGGWFFDPQREVHRAEAEEAKRSEVAALRRLLSAWPQEFLKSSHSTVMSERHLTSRHAGRDVHGSYPKSYQASSQHSHVSFSRDSQYQKPCRTDLSGSDRQGTNISTLRTDGSLLGTRSGGILLPVMHFNNNHKSPESSTKTTDSVTKPLISCFSDSEK